MGLIAGILTSNETFPSLNEKIVSMAEVQKHRDDSPAVKYSDERFSGAMANRHNTIFAKTTITEPSFDGLFVMLDGVVLDVLEHCSYFESKGQRIPLSCTAIVAAAYREWGKDFMSHLEGEFACAIWDAKNKILVLARDPYGHKPLHYYRKGKDVIFSSEIKGILAAGVTREVDLVSLSDFLTLNGIPCPATIFKDIYQVPPGTILIASEKGVELHMYWSPKLQENMSLRLEEAVEQVESTLRNAVKKRMMAKDTYCFLSGGIDSSALLSFATELSGKPIDAITVAFDEAEKNELDDASVMAKHVGARHHHVIAKPDNFFDMLDTLIYHHDSPFADTSAYPSYYAGKMGRICTDIILTGDGPDQTLAGSAHHLHAQQSDLFVYRNRMTRAFYKWGAFLAERIQRNPAPSFLSKMRRNFYRKSLDPVQMIYELRSYCPNIVKQHLCGKGLWQTHLKNNPYRHPERWFNEAKGLDNVNKYLFADIKFYVPDDLMIKVDRMCMAHGLETLSPFQDVQLGRYIQLMPGSYKLNTAPDGTITTKYILKKVCEKRFPASTLQKKKQGFGIPLKKWLKQNNADYLKSVLLDSRTLNRGYFEKSALKSMVYDFVAGRDDYFYASHFSMFALITLELWHRQYID